MNLKFLEFVDKKNNDKRRNIEKKYKKIWKNIFIRYRMKIIKAKN